MQARTNWDRRNNPANLLACSNAFMTLPATQGLSFKTSSLKARMCMMGKKPFLRKYLSSSSRALANSRAMFLEPRNRGSGGCGIMMESISP